MYFSLKSDCFFRKYGKIGHIIRPIISIEEVVDECGSIFIEQLGYEPKEITDIVVSLRKYFSEVDTDQLTKDALEFYYNLVSDGFLNFSESLADFKNEGFSYSTLNGRIAYNNFHVELEESSSHFLREYFKSNPQLESFHIELTSKCNERCVHCYIPHEKKNTEIDFELMIDTLNQCKDMGVLTIIFSGGEPMLHPHFVEFMRYAKDLDFNITVLSNLTLLNDQIIEALKYKHASCVNVSLYSMNPKIHDSITSVNGSFEKTKKNILKLIKNNIPVQINCPVMKPNKDSFYEVINWGQNLKCSVITDYLIMARFDHSIDNLDYRLSKEDLNNVIQKLIENDLVFQTNLKSRKINIDQYSDIKPDDIVCGVGMTTLCMIANGDVYPCAGWQQYICGNIKDTSLKNIWNNSSPVNYLRSIRQKDFKKCVDCNDRDFCLMCMSRNSNEDVNGNIFNIPRITCEAAHIHHKIVDEFMKKNEIL